MIKIQIFVSVLMVVALSLHLAEIGLELSAARRALGSTWPVVHGRGTGSGTTER